MKITYEKCLLSSIAKRLLGILVLLILLGTNVLAQYKLKVGNSQYLPINPPRGTVRSATWNCDKGLFFDKSSSAGAIIKVNHYFEGTAYVRCSYVYEWLGSYDGNMHATTGSASYAIQCVAGEASISKTELKMKIGQKEYLHCYRNDGYDKPVWYSSNEDVAVVDKDGEVKAVGSGTAIITLDPIIAPVLKCRVTVERIFPTSINLTPNTVDVALNSSQTLNVSYKPSGASATLTWTSANTSVATVSASGVVKGISEGSTTITAKTDNGLTAKATVKVTRINATSITVSPNDLTLSIGESKSLKAKCLPSNATADISWWSENENIATVSSTGTVKGVAKGETTIVACTNNGLTAEVPVTVNYATADDVDANDLRRGDVSQSFVGEGTENSPYLISSAADLRLLSDSCRLGNNLQGRYFLMTNDIVINQHVINEENGEVNDASDFERWIPIGRKANNNNEKFSFAGHFDGGNHSISGIYINRENVENDNGNLALFGLVFGNSSIKNVSLKDSYIFNGSGIISKIYNFRTSQTEIENCHNYAKLESNEGTYGGILGTPYNEYGEVIIRKCSNHGTLTNLKGKISGILGWSYTVYTKVNDCVNVGNVQGYYAQGIACGHDYHVANCVNRGKIQGYFVSGIAEFPGRINNCVNIGDLISSSNQARCVGSITQYTNNGVIYDCVYLKSKCSQVYGDKVKGNIRKNKGYSESEMKQQNVLDALNKNKPNGCSSWVSGPDGYPTLDWIDDKEGTGIVLPTIGREMHTMGIYSIDGKLVRTQSYNTDGLPKGIYLINGKKFVVK